MSLIALGMNLLLAALLLAALGLGWRLDRRLRAVRDSQAAFAKAAAELDSAAARARAGLAELRAAGDEAVDLLGGRIARAREAADRLDKSLARAEAMPVRAPAPSRVPADEALEPTNLAGLLALAGEAPASRMAARRFRPSVVDDELFVDGGRA